MLVGGLRRAVGPHVIGVRIVDDDKDPVQRFPTLRRSSDSEALGKRHRRFAVRNPGHIALERVLAGLESGTEPCRVQRNRVRLRLPVVPADSEFRDSSTLVRMRPESEDAVFDDASSHPFRGFALPESCRRAISRFIAEYSIMRAEISLSFALYATLIAQSRTVQVSELGEWKDFDRTMDVAASQQQGEPRSSPSRTAAWASPPGRSGGWTAGSSERRCSLPDCQHLQDPDSLLSLSHGRPGRDQISKSASRSPTPTGCPGSGVLQHLRVGPQADDLRSGDADDDRLRQ